MQHIQSPYFLQYPLDGKAAVVTGAGQGIGQTIALYLGLAGAFVLLVDIDKQSCRKSEDVLKKAGVKDCLSVTADVSREEQVCGLAETVQDIGKELILVNNAGIAGPTDPVESISLKEWEATLAVNVRSVFLCCKHVVPIITTWTQYRIPFW